MELNIAEGKSLGSLWGNWYHCPIAEFCVIKRLSTAKQAASLFTGHHVHLDTMHCTLLSLYMMFT